MSTNQSKFQTPHKRTLRANFAHSMHYAHEVLGAPILAMCGAAQLIAADLTTCLPQPAMHRKSISMRTDTQEYAAMVLPAETDFYVVHVQHNTVFVQAGNSTQLHLLHTQWHGIRSLLPPHSICRCLVYKDKDQTMRMGMYDLIQIGSKQLLEQGVLQRHILLHTHLRGKQLPDNIKIHWVGFEKACAHIMTQCRHAQAFECHRILRLQNEAYSFVLAPIQI